MFGEKVSSILKNIFVPNRKFGGFILFLDAQDELIAFSASGIILFSKSVKICPHYSIILSIASSQLVRIFVLFANRPLTIRGADWPARLILNASNGTVEGLPSM